MALFAPRRRRHLSQRQLAPGSYLTDGEHLFRVASVFDDGRSALVAIEDCLTLETRAYASTELAAMALWRVRGKHVEVLESPPPPSRREDPAVVR